MPLKYRISVILLCLLFTSAIQLVNSNLVTFFNKDGKEVAYTDILDAALANDIILFGELHDDSTCHYYEQKFCNDMIMANNAQVTIGMEMFESDDQLKINEYLKGQISQSSFESEARFWPNYTSDYKPIIETAKKFNVPVIATNIPRRYASMVYKKGLASLKELTKNAKKLMVPLPLKVDLELDGYKEMLKMGGGHGGNNILYAQAIKDATMAHFILKNKQKKKTFIHLNGNYHSKNYEGIYWFLKKKKRSNKIMTIATVRQDKIDQLEPEHIGEADFIICVKNP